ncbi:DUF4153 domain-containing protein [Sphingobacterium corticibacter]|uniref:DUF4153 domain-containing protein n=1 Tax=Sphingobacterium corticibacter TaxID=2171749 RepID=A0A2T8HEW8_9SPHI|nr:DUF4153 domain-containing protein [Sphingobacterium corticibacter]PVH23954.1 hypothetical protein DC487_16005 [Sphingobacterium corticibacter]
MKLTLKNRLPSISSIFTELMISTKRFPAECVYALIGAFAALQLVRDDVLDSGNGIYWIRLLMLAAIAFPLNLSISLLLARRKTCSLGQFWIIKSLIAMGSIVFFFVLDPESYPQDFVHFWLLFIAVVLLVSFAAYLQDGDTLAWWHFNKILIIRLLTGALYSVVLGAGLSAAFATVDKLLIEMDWVYLRYMWVFIFTVFFPLYFLSGVPKRFDASLLIQHYPRGLKYFSQYVLIPLAFVYLMILLVYEFKILVQWQLPDGMVSALILGYSGIGILSLLLIYPIRNNHENAWIRSYSTYFYVFLTPLFVLLMLAVLKRVSTYGITYQRYLLLAIAAWLLFQIIYFLAYKRATIKAIPISLFLLALLINYGPQSAMSVSLASQKKILLRLFESEGLVSDGFLQPVAEDSIAVPTAVRMASSLMYILDNYHPEVLQSILPIDLEKQRDRISKDQVLAANNTNTYRNARYELNNQIKRDLHLDKFAYYGRFNQDDSDLLTMSYHFKSSSSTIDIRDFQYVIEQRPYPDSTQIDTVNNLPYRQSKDAQASTVTLRVGGVDYKFVVAEFIRQIVEKQPDQLKSYEISTPDQGFTKQYAIPSSSLRLSQKIGQLEVMLQLQDISFDYKKNKEITIHSARGAYLLKFNGDVN